MIISHKYKFIFVKPTKVAGTSIEIALAKQCGDKDIITPISKFNPENDSYEYNQPSRNYQDMGFYNHITPDEIINKIGSEIWKSYYKFTIVRNPWDLVISRFYWNNNWNKNKSRKLNKIQINKNTIRNNIFKIKAYKILFNYLIEKIKKKPSLSHNSNDFNTFIKSFNQGWTNARFYFDKSGNSFCDFYIKYENLDNDYKKVCQKLGIPYEKLLKTKNKLRKEKKHYSTYYNKLTKEKIRLLFKKELDFFGYKFL